jgi:conjugative transposon TraN protein
MRKIVSFFLLLLPFSLSGQIQKIESKPIYVDYTNTTHLIFSTDIKYFSAIEDIIICRKTEIENVLSIKSNTQDWKDKTTLSVATADGKFYNFDVSFSENNLKTSYYIKRDSIGIPIHLGVNNFNDLHLLFNSPVKYVDYGNDAIEAIPVENVQNIVRVSTFDKFDFTTNVSVITADKRFYTFSLDYKEDEKNYSFLVGEPQENKEAILAQEDLTDDSRETIVRLIQDKGRRFTDLGVKKSSVLFSIYNIFVRDNKLVFRFNLKNNSNIKYDIDYMRFYIVDKKITKQSASQEIEYTPLFLDNFKPTIEGKGNNTYSVCFEKFTIPDNKYFVIEINEKNGGRHIYYKIRNREIEQADYI